MNESIERCLRQIADIRDIANDRSLAYVARSRIGRLVLRLTALVSSLASVSAPDIPGVLRLPEGQNERVTELTEACNQLFQVSKTITQPSEPLDVRWCTGWNLMLGKLAEIEHHLVRLRDDLSRAIK